MQAGARVLRVFGHPIARVSAMAESSMNAPLCLEYVRGEFYSRHNQQKYCGNDGLRSSCSVLLRRGPEF